MEWVASLTAYRSQLDGIDFRQLAIKSQVLLSQEWQCRSFQAVSSLLAALRSSQFGRTFTLRISPQDCGLRPGDPVEVARVLAFLRSLAAKGELALPSVPDHKLRVEAEADGMLCVTFDTASATNPAPLPLSPFAPAAMYADSRDALQAAVREAAAALAEPPSSAVPGIRFDAGAWVAEEQRFPCADLTLYALVDAHHAALRALKLPVPDNPELEKLAAAALPPARPPPVKKLRAEARKFLLEGALRFRSADRAAKHAAQPTKCCVLFGPADDQALSAAGLQRVGRLRKLLKMKPGPAIGPPEPLDELESLLLPCERSQAELIADLLEAPSPEEPPRRQTRRVRPARRRAEALAEQQPDQLKRRKRKLSSDQHMKAELCPQWDPWQSGWRVAWLINDCLRQRHFLCDTYDATDQARKKAAADVFCRSVEAAAREYERLTRRIESRTLDDPMSSSPPSGSTRLSDTPLGRAVSPTLLAAIRGPPKRSVELVAFDTLREALEYAETLDHLELILAGQRSVWQQFLGFDLSTNHGPLLYNDDF